MTLRLKSTTSLGLLLAATLTVPLLALWQGQGQGQDGVEDWARHVDKACNSPRYGLRLAAARKLAEGGEAAVPAIRAFAQQHGANALPSALVDAIADGGNLGVAVLDLLRQWSGDGDFYWRSSALRGLALRMRTLQRVPELAGAPAAIAASRTLFEEHRDDDAWLMRTHARLGLWLLGAVDASEATAGEPDPRARVRLTRLLLEHGASAPDLQPLLDALAETRTFLGDPWGERLATEAHKALKTWLGDAHPHADGAAFEDKAAAIAALRDAAAQKSGQSLVVPAIRGDGGDAPIDGCEILSCKYGDQFLAWHADGTITFDLDLRERVRLPAVPWQALRERLAALPLEESLGVVICDTLRLRLTDPERHSKFAPGALPPKVVDWLKDLAAAIEESGASARAAMLRRGLGQFDGR